MTTKTIWIINQYASTPKTGIGGRHFYLAKELAKQGHRVCLIAAGYTHLLRNEPVVKAKMEIERIENFSFVWLKMPKYKGAHDKKRIINWLLFSWKLQKLQSIADDNPDVIIVSSPSLFSYLGAERLAKKFKAKLCFEVRDIWPLTLTQVGGHAKSHPLIRIMQKVEDRAYQKADKVISNLPNAVEHMVGRGMSKDKFCWLPNGFDPEELDKQQALSADIIDQIPKNKFIIGYTGTFGKANGLESFIDAATLLKNHPDIYFILVGQGREKDFLKEKITKNKLKNCKFIPAISKMQVQTILGLFDLAYIGLTKDPLFKYGVSPNKLFDYLYSETPVIYAIDSGTYLPVDAANAGISIAPECPNSLVSAILALQAMPQAQRAQLGKNGKRYVEEHHDYQKIAQNLSNIIETI